MTLTCSSHWDSLANQVLHGKTISREDALTILEQPDKEIPQLLASAFQIRQHFFPNKVACCMLVNAQSGLCSEDCIYCSQSKISQAEIPRYKLLSEEAIIQCARRHREYKNYHFSIVTSGKLPSKQLLNQVCRVITRIKEEEPTLHVCASLGLLTEQDAKLLKEAGLDRYHHNINTSPRFHPQIVTTHHFEDRIATIRAAQSARLSVCSGVIIGMGETTQDIVDMAFILRELKVDSIPINFLHPISGTPLGDRPPLPATYCLKVLCMFRFVCPSQEIRLAGGREYNLRTLQPMALYPANGMFVGDYLTTKGNQIQQDLQMIQDLGFTMEYPSISHQKA